MMLLEVSHNEFIPLIPKRIYKIYVVFDVKGFYFSFFIPVNYEDAHPHYSNTRKWCGAENVLSVYNLNLVNLNTSNK